MNRLAAGRLAAATTRGDVQVALGRGRRADADGAVGHAGRGARPVGSRVDGDRLDAELVQRADHADGDLAPVRDQDPREHLERWSGGGRDRLELEQQLAVLDRLGVPDVDRTHDRPRPRP